MVRRLVLMTGSHHMHVFWYESGVNETPAQLQIMYIIDQQRWIPRRSAFLRPPNMEKENEIRDAGTQFVANVIRLIRAQVLSQIRSVGTRG